MALVILTPGGRSQRPNEIDSPNSAPWYCVNLPPSKAPLTLRCHQGQRFFTVEKVKAD